MFKPKQLLHKMLRHNNCNKQLVMHCVITCLHAAYDTN